MVFTQMIQRDPYDRKTLEIKSYFHLIFLQSVMHTKLIKTFQKETNSKKKLVTIKNQVTRHPIYSSLPHVGHELDLVRYLIQDKVATTLETKAGFRSGLQTSLTFFRSLL